METVSLEQLKAENEVEEVLETPEEVEQEEESTEDEAPEWAKGSVPVAKHVEVKHKLKARLSEQQDEISVLRREIETLKSNPKQPETLKAPTRAECDFDDDVYAEKLANYYANLAEQKIKEAQQAIKKESTASQQEQEISSSVDQHYSRAAELVNKNLVSADNFRAADEIVRRTLENLYPNAGDYIADSFIANLGEGSEKVFMHIGFNPVARAELERLLKADKSGMRAMGYLSELKYKFNTAQLKPVKQSRADEALQGDASAKLSSQLNAYKKAEKAGDVSGMIRAKREAKTAGINTSNW